jgi:AraC-like DNA-binding protein
MDELSITSANKSTLSFIGKKDLLVSKESMFSPRKVFFTVVSEMSLFLINFHQKRQQKYRDLWENLNGKIGNGTPSRNSSRSKVLPISKEIVEAVLLKLNAFEQQRGYLSTKVSLSSLSKSLETNSSYLSKIINHTKGKTFKNYLNELRVAYAYTELKNDPQKRKYTIEAIAFDFGFKSAENFSKKFKSAYGMYPSKYLRELGA